MMKSLENKMVGLNAKLPQLPQNIKEVISKWLWVGAIIAIVVNIMGIMAVLGIGALGSFIMLSAGFSFMSVRIWITILAGVVCMGVTVIAEIIAVKPLKEKAYRGWYIAFCVVVFQLLFSVIYDVASSSFGNILSTAVSFAISMYLLVQTREYFAKEEKSEA